MSLEKLRPDCGPERVCEVLERDGAVIILNLMGQALLEEALGEAEPLMRATGKGIDPFSGYETTRTGGLIAAMPTCRRVTMDSLVLGAAETFLAPWCTRIQLHLTQLIRILVGEAAQSLHRDRAVFGDFLSTPACRHMEPQLQVMWALTEFSPENGATRVVPGSQAWDYDRLPADGDVVCAAMPAGSALLFTGSVIHGGGRNTTSQERIGLNVNYSLGWLRQAENQYLSCPPDVARTLDPKLQELLGYTMGHFGLGYFSPVNRIPGAPGTIPPELALGRLPSQMIGSS